jgi:hypothetical protein
VSDPKNPYELPWPTEYEYVTADYRGLVTRQARLRLDVLIVDDPLEDEDPKKAEEVMTFSFRSG